MKIVLSLLGLLIMTSAIGTPAPAYAQNYPWCAYYSGRGFGGATNCGFTSFQQCMATVSGIGGLLASLSVSVLNALRLRGSR